MIEIPLSGRNPGRYVAVVDEGDAHLAAFRWYPSRRARTVYAVRKETAGGKSASIYLHRAVLGAPKGLQVDHVNGDGLDCRRANLRPADRAENQWNQWRRRDNASGFKGVYWDASRKRWRANVMFRGRRVRLGRFASAEDAARARDEVAKKLHGEFASLNFGDSREKVQ